MRAPRHGDDENVARMRQVRNGARLAARHLEKALYAEPTRRFVQQAFGALRREPKVFGETFPFKLPPFLAELQIPSAWRTSAALIFEQRRAVVLVIGGSDAGKRFLSLLRRGAEVAIVSADVGQPGFGPPAAVTLACLAYPVDFATLSPAAYFFVGSANPIGRLLPLVVGTANLVREASASFVIVDTTGLIQGAGRVLKNYKIEALRPDVIVALERQNELASTTAAARHAWIVRLEPSRGALQKRL